MAELVARCQAGEVVQKLSGKLYTWVTDEIEAVAVVLLAHNNEITQLLPSFHIYLTFEASPR